MALAPRLIEAYVARANVRMNRNWDFVGARSDLDFAMSIDPNNMELLQAYSSFLWITGKLDEALEVQRRCVARNPLASKTWDWLGVMLMNARDYPGCAPGIAALRGTVSLFGLSAAAHDPRGDLCGQP